MLKIGIADLGTIAFSAGSSSCKLIESSIIHLRFAQLFGLEAQSMQCFCVLMQEVNDETRLYLLYRLLKLHVAPPRIRSGLPEIAPSEGPVHSYSSLRYCLVGFFLRLCCSLKIIVAQKLLYQINVCHEHSPTAISLQPQGVKSVTAENTAFVKYLPYCTQLPRLTSSLMQTKENAGCGLNAHHSE